MKKELLMASALVSTLGAASVAEAVTATMSGSLKIGQEFDSPDTGTDTNNNKSLANFTVSLSETTDAGTTVSSSFMLENESGGVDDDNAIKLTFSDGSAVELLNAGNASGTHDVSVPGASGEMGVAGTTSANAPTGLDFATPSGALGIEWHSAADFMADGLKVSASFSTNDGVAATATAKLDQAWGVGATYVTSAGDTALTIGTGLAGSEYKMTGTAATNDTNGFHVGISAVTGDLTVAVGFADGDKLSDDVAAGTGGDNNLQVDGSVVKAGIKYVTGDITLNLGAVSGEAKDSDTTGTAGLTDDSWDEVNASLTYAVASGVSAIVGYTNVDIQDEGATTTDGGSSWYVGAVMSF
jgi:predicted porin